MRVGSAMRALTTCTCCQPDGLKATELFSVALLNRKTLYVVCVCVLCLGVYRVEREGGGIGGRYHTLPLLLSVSLFSLHTHTRTAVV
jgi:hypothetical protein